MFSSLRRHFAERIAAEGARRVIGDVFGALPAAPGTAAFHAAIRLAYGLDAGHVGEIAAGLAMLVAAHAPMVLEPGSHEAADIEAAWIGLSARFGGTHWPGDSITSRLAAVANHAEFSSVLPPRPVEAGWPALYAAARDLHAATGNFTALHMATGSHAASVVQSALPEALRGPWLDAFWIAYAAAIVAIGVPGPRPSHPPTPTMAWADICSLAIASDDEHVIKLVDVCRREDLERPDPANRCAALRVIHPTDSLGRTVA